MGMCVGACGGQKRGLDLLELQLQGCELPNVGAGSQTLVLCKSSKCCNCWAKPSVHRSFSLWSLGLVAQGLW